MGKNIKIIYGSSTGNTRRAAETIAARLGAATVINVAEAGPDDFKADLLILGSSTWGLGELQDDWISGIAMLDSMDLAGRKVAVFGLGDQSGFADTFVDAMGILADKAEERGASIIGQTPSSGYMHSSSAAEKDGHFCGLALDESNEPEKTPERIAKSRLAST